MIIEKLVIKTGSACTLKCEKCGEFNPYLAGKGKSFTVNISDLSNDVYRLSCVVEKIKLIHIAGGEALIHKDLFMLINFVASLENVDKIEIVSNGTIIPDDIMIHTLLKNKSKVSILISDYSASGIDNSATIQFLREKAIPYHVIHDMVWLDKTDTSCKQIDENELNNIVDSCQTYRKELYLTLSNGILNAHCPTAGSLMYYLDLYEEMKGQYINLRDKKNISADDLKTLNEHTVLSACKYCVPSYKAKKCRAGEQIKGMEKKI